MAGNAPLAGAEQRQLHDRHQGADRLQRRCSDSALKVGETSTLTITFHEAVTNFDNTDITSKTVR